MPAYPTPHIAAKPEDFAKTVLMPGDPLRARYIAEHYLEQARLVNDVRGIQGYTGRYQGVPVSVMASGMGQPSIGIYSYELFHIFGVENIIRIGSAGGLSDRVRLRDIVIGMGACTDSGFSKQYDLPGVFAPIADYTLLTEAVEAARRIGATVHIGNLASTDVFYSDRADVNEKWRDMGVLAVEMESAALYMTAARAGKRALAICTCSDHLFTGESLDAENRETSFTQMMEIGLETALRMETV